MMFARVGTLCVLACFLPRYDAYKIQKELFFVQCAKNDDCGQDEKCSAGICQKELFVQCAENDHCGQDEKCSAGICQKELFFVQCAKNDDCGQDEKCSAGICQKELFVQCAKNDHCGQDEKCIAGICQKELFVRCAKNDDCGQDGKCSGGICQKVDFLQEKIREDILNKLEVSSDSGTFKCNIHDCRQYARRSDYNTQDKCRTEVKAKNYATKGCYFYPSGSGIWAGCMFYGTRNNQEFGFNDKLPFLDASRRPCEVSKQASVDIAITETMARIYKDGEDTLTQEELQTFVLRKTNIQRPDQMLNSFFQKFMDGNKETISKKQMSKGIKMFLLDDLQAGEQDGEWLATVFATRLSDLRAVSTIGMKYGVPKQILSIME